jgi:hypothetical protein
VSDASAKVARNAFAEARADEALRAREAWNRRPAMLKHAHRATPDQRKALEVYVQALAQLAHAEVELRKLGIPADQPATPFRTTLGWLKVTTAHGEHWRYVGPGQFRNPSMPKTI